MQSAPLKSEASDQRTPLTGSASSNLRQLPAHLQLWSFSFLDGLSLTVVLSAAKWSFNEEKTERLFQTAFERRCEDSAKLMFAPANGSGSWRKAFKLHASDELKWRKGGFKRYNPSRPMEDVELASGCFFKQSTETGCSEAFSLIGSPLQLSTIAAAFAQVVMLHGEELLVTAPLTEGKQFKQLRVRDLLGNVVHEIALAAELTAPAECAFGRFFGYCAAQSAIHVISLDDGKLESAIDMRAAFKSRERDIANSAISPLSATSLLLEFSENYRAILVTRSSTTVIGFPPGGRGTWPVSHGVCCVNRALSIDLRMIRDSAVAAGMQRVAMLDPSLLSNGVTSVRRPTLDLLIFTLRGPDFGGDVFVVDLRGQLVRHLPRLIPRERCYIVRWAAAWRTTLAVCSESTARASFMTIVQFE